VVTYDEAQADYGLESDEDVIYYPEGEAVPEGEYRQPFYMLAVLTNQQGREVPTSLIKFCCIHGMKLTFRTRATIRKRTW